MSAVSVWSGRKNSDFRKREISKQKKCDRGIQTWLREIAGKFTECKSRDYGGGSGELTRRYIMQFRRSQYHVGVAVSDKAPILAAFAPCGIGLSN